MANETALTFAIMDAPFESERSTTVFRLLAAALGKGHAVNVFAYEGAVGLTFAQQKQHANAVHGRNEVEENHPLPKEWVAALLREAARARVKLDWINCGLCVDERGVADALPGVRRGSPADFWKMAAESHNTLVVPTR
jgi:tRNA 2-thiouridine synthesizing protein D